MKTYSLKQPLVHDAVTKRMDFVTLDFETANERRNSACAIGLTKVIGGQIRESFYRLIRPEEVRFAKWNVRVHGITAEQVADSPTIGEVWPDVLRFIGDDIVVSHSASFDTSVLRHSLHSANVMLPTMTYFCSLQMSKLLWPQYLAHTLGFLAKVHNLELNHHNAESDANATAELVLLGAKEKGSTELRALADSLGITLGMIFSHDEWHPTSAPRIRESREQVEIELPEGFAIERHPLHKKNVLFTGSLTMMSRDDAHRVVECFGGSHKNGMSKQVDFLVTGTQDVRQLAEGTTESAKLRKAIALINSGHNVTIITESEFNEMIFNPQSVTMSNEPILPFLAEDDLTEEVCEHPMDWIARSFESSEEWKKKATNIYLSLNCDSDVARNRLASMARQYFVETTLEAEDVSRWKKGFSGQEVIRVVPPKVSASNAAYIDWFYIADYLLLACAGIMDKIDEENLVRDGEYRQVLDSFNIRRVIFAAKAKLIESPEIGDEELLEALRQDFSNAAISHVKESRRLIRNGEQMARPIQPAPPVKLTRYQSLHF